MSILGDIEQKTYEEAVAENYQLLFNELYDALFVHIQDPENIFKITLVDVNKSACRMLGYTRKQLLSPPSIDFVKHDEEEKASIKDIVKQLDTTKHARFEKIFITSDGREINVDCSAVLMEYMGRPSVITITRDITERKKAEEALANEATGRRILIEQSRDGIVVLDQNGKVYEANQRFADMLGYSPEEIKQLHLWDWDVGKTKEHFLKMIGINDIPDDCFVTQHRRKDGTIFDVEISNNKATFAGQQLVFTVCRDITERKKAEDALTDEITRRRILIDQSKDGIVVLDHTGKVFEANQRFIEMLGYTPEEITHLHVWDWEAAFTKEELLDMLQAEGGANNIFETRHRRKDGSECFIEISSNKAVIAGQKLTFCICRDITDRKQAETALADELTRRRILVDQSIDGIVILDHNGKVFEANQHFMEMLGYTPEEMSHLHVWDWEVGFTKKKLLKMLQEGDAGDDIFETRHRRKDGSEYFVEISSNKAVIAGQSLILSICRDITDRKQAEEALADEIKRRKILVDQSSDGIVVIDQNGKVYEANQRFAEMLGYSVEEAQQLYIFDWEYRFTPEHTLEMIRSDNESGRHFETSHRRKDGSIFDVEISTNAAIFAGQKLIFCVCRDITDRKQAEAEQKALLEKLQEVNVKLEQSNMALQDFAYIASHDLREPLRKVSSFGSLLEDSLSEKLDDDEKENLQFMVDGAQRMQTMIDDLLSYSRLTTMAKTPVPVDLNEVIKGLKKLEIAALLEETGGTITVPQMLPTVHAEESQMRQLFQNLIGNGLKFHKPDIKPEITIDFSEQDNGMIRIEIRDNGIGIPEEYNEQIFTMFKRLHSRDTYKGNGIGLAVCKKIVNRHGGEIRVESKPGEGATFRFTLPRSGGL